MIDDEINVGQSCVLHRSMTKKELEELGYANATKLKGTDAYVKVHCEITHVIRESDGWIRNVYVRREDNNKDDPFEKLLRCIRMSNDYWYSEDGMVEI